MFYFMLRTKKIIKNEIDFDLYLLCQSHLKSFILCGFNMIAYLHDVGICYKRFFSSISAYYKNYIWTYRKQLF